ncbi:MAG: hypothetical protein R2720_07520 [Candidatus Nanopelagicales bacterium]
MKRMALAVILAIGLAGCSQTDTATPPTSPAATPSVSETPMESPAPTQSPSPTRTTAKPETTDTPKPSGPATNSFCAYLKKTSGAQQQVEDPSQFVALVNGALAVAPGAIAEDLALYAESVQKLADTVTAGPKKAAAADKWLTQNEAAVSAAEENVNNYSLSVCGQPFITGEGG